MYDYIQRHFPENKTTGKDTISTVAKEWGEGRDGYKQIAKEFWGDKELFCVLIIEVMAGVYTIY